MPELTVVTRDGGEHVVIGAIGHSVMEIIRDNGFDELLALCGGSCSCATCHVFVDERGFARLPAIGADEDDLLDSSEHRTEQSRLSCQLKFTDELSGLRVTIAPKTDVGAARIGFAQSSATVIDQTAGNQHDYRKCHARSCNCGAIRYQISTAPIAVVACHCTQCRRQSGAAFSVNLIVRASTMVIEGATDSWEDRETSSGAPLAREHCGRCGSPIRSVPSASPKLVAVKAGTLDDPSAYAPGLHIWTRSKLPWVTIPEELPTFEENPPA